MRNLKRALSLTLASVMLLGMMVVGTSAAAGYSDVDAEDNVEAIEVLQTIEVMVGDERGFGPDRPVTRNEMAVVMGKLLNLNYNYYASTCPFSDVATWARGWVGAAAANGIVSGRGNGIYDGEATVTAVEAASMMMRALGYFQYTEDYADGFQLATVRQGSEIGIFNQVGTDGNTPMTRNQVAQMALNALRSEMVTFTGTPGISVNGVTVGYRAEYTPRTGTEAKYNAIASLTTTLGRDESRYYIQLGEQLYDGDLRLENDLDAFQRPARTWEYKGEQIGTYVKKELLRQEWTEKVTGKMLYDLLTKNTIATYDFVIAIDGEMEEKILAPEGGKDYGYFTRGNLVRTNTEAVGNTGKGVLTQVFVDNNSEDPTVYISIINTYLAIAVDDYNERKDEASFTVWSVDDPNKALVKDAGVHDVILDVKGEDFDIKDVKEDDIVLVRVAENEIKEIIDPEILSDLTINSFSKKDWVNVGGTRYDYANTAQYDTDALYQYSNSNLKELTYNVVLDMYGYLIGIEQNEDPDQYVFITGNDGGSSDLRNKEADMAAIFLDGTMKVIKVDVKNSTGDLSGGAIINRWFTYTVNSSDVYTLNAISTTYSATGVGQWAQNVADGNNYVNGPGSPSTTYSIDKAHVSLVASSDGTASDRRVYGNDDTVYINVSTGVINAKTTYNYQAYNAAATPALANTVNTGNGFYVGTPTANPNTNYYLAASGNVQLAVIIDDVDSVTTGVKNASLVMDDVVAADYKKPGGSAYAASEVAVPKSEIYTLYDGGDVIAAITIGEDQGTTSHYVYVHSDDVAYEEYGHSTTKAPEGQWLWEREVIMDGKIDTLKEISDGDYAKIDTAHMDQGAWYKVSFDADGYVRKVEDTSAWPTNRHGTDVQNVEDYYDANQDLVIVEVNYTGSTIDHDHAPDLATGAHLGGGLVFTNGTLYTDYANRKGFSVSTNVNVVYVNAKLNRGVKEPTGNLADVTWFDETVDGYTNYSGLERALRLIDSRDANYFCGVLSAVVEDGIATSIIINDTFGEYIDQGGSTETPTGKYSSVVDAELAAKITGDPLNLEKATINGSNVLKLPAYYAGGDNVKQQLIDALEYMGYKVTKAGLDSTVTTKWIFTVEKNGREETITCDTKTSNGDIGDAANGYFLVDVDGTKEYVKKDATKTIAQGSNKGTGWIISTDGGKTWAYGKAYGTASAAITADTQIKVGYVKAPTTITPGSAAGGVTVVANDANAADYVVAGGTVTYAVKYHTGGSASTGDPTTLTLTVDASADDAVPGATATVAKDTNVAAATPSTVNMTVKAGEKDITTVTVTPST